MKIVVLDGYTENPGDLTWEKLESLGDLKVYDRTPIDKIVERIGDAEIVITNKTPINKDVMMECPSIKMIALLATGYDVVDVKEAAKRNIPVCNVPAYGPYSVAQSAIALLLEICNHVGHHNQAVHEGAWENCADWCFWEKPLMELQDKTMGIIGYGRIGQTTAAIARALGMNIIAYDCYHNPDLKDVTYVEFDELCKQSDVIVLHCSLQENNKGLINKQAISNMKKNAIIINNARGPLINEADLAEALNNGRIYAAGVDVVSSEPIDGNNPLLHAKNCIITPHMSWGSIEARRRIMDMTYQNVQTFLKGSLSNCVNMEERK